MNQAANTPAAETTARLASGLPRRPRTGAALASLTVTLALFGSVVLGMTSMGDADTSVVARAAAPVAARA